MDGTVGGAYNLTTVSTLTNLDKNTITSDNFVGGIPPNGTMVPPQTIIGTAGNDSLVGAYFDDALNGLEGADILDGGPGADTLDGGGGGDALNGGTGNDSLIGGADTSADVLSGNTGDDTLRGGGGVDALYGGGGADLLDGGDGNDHLYGHVSGGSSEVDGNDTLLGGAGDDTLMDTGGGNDLLDGGEGNDYLYVYESALPVGNDTLLGGGGNDRIDVILFNGISAGNVISVNGGDGNDEIRIFTSQSHSGILHVQADGGIGVDTFRYQNYDDYSTNAAQMLASLDGVRLINFEAGVGGDLLDVGLFLGRSGNFGYTGGNPFSTSLGYLRLTQSGADSLLQWDVDGTVGGAYNLTTVSTLTNLDKNTITSDNFVGKFILGTEGNDNLVGEWTNDTLVGLGGDDTLDGAEGDDILDGGGGDDIFIVRNLGQIVREIAGAGNADKVKAAIDDYHLAEEVEDLDLDVGVVRGSGNSKNNHLRGNDGHNHLDGKQGADRMEGGHGRDTYYVDDAGDDVYEADNVLSLSLPLGSPPGDALGLHLGNGDKLPIDLGSAIDTVIASINYTLTNYVENLTLATGSDALIAGGNTLDNRLAGNLLDNTLTGGLGNDTLDGGTGRDTATYAGTKAGYLVTRVGAGYTVTDSNTSDGDEGIDTLAGIEVLQFADGLVNLGRRPGYDHNGDGRADLLLKNDATGGLYSYQMNGAAIDSQSYIVASAPAGWSLKETRADYNGDGKSDLLWFNQSTNSLYAYLMNGSSISAEGSIAQNVPAGWSVLETKGDYNGDGKSDILWKNSNNNATYIYLMNGLTIQGEGYERMGIGADWSIQNARADYNNDGKSDILWKNTTTGALYLDQIDGTGIQSEGLVIPAAPAGWTLKDANADYNGDGNADLLWFNPSSNSLYAYLMDGTRILSEGLIAQNVPAGWAILETKGDYNGDGKADILWKNSNNNATYIYLMNGLAIQGEGYERLGIGAGWDVADGKSDYNGDGKSDILWKHQSSGELYLDQVSDTGILAEGALGTPVPAGWNLLGDNLAPRPVTRPQGTDLNGDGKTDILLQNTSTGALYSYQMNGTAIQTQGYIIDSAPAGWSVQETKADYNGDGKSDILWFHPSTNSLYAYLLDGQGIASQGIIAQNVPAGWNILETKGDYNNDGKSDILWKNSNNNATYIYLMNGLTIQGEGYERMGIGADWGIQDARADYNGDGKSDILWKNSVNGALYLDQIDGTGIQSEGYVIDSAPAGWNVLDAKADYNGDHKSDILWFNPSTNSLYAYLMDGQGIASQGLISQNVPAGWNILETKGDYNGDGKADILWKNTNSNATYMYLMNGLAIQSEGYERFGIGAGWDIADARGDYNGDGKSDILWRHSDGNVYLDTVNGPAIQGEGMVATGVVGWVLA